MGRCAKAGALTKTSIPQEKRYDNTICWGGRKSGWAILTIYREVARPTYPQDKLLILLVCRWATAASGPQGGESAAH